MGVARAPARRWLGVALFGTYPILMHLTLIWAEGTPWGTTLVLAELAAVAALALISFRRFHPLMGLALVLAIVTLVFRNAGNGVIVAASGLPHAIANASLLAVFGASLLPGRRPLITALSERLEGGIVPPEIARYTRSVTLAWCGFFAVQLLLSLLLLLFAPIAVWSAFVNLLTLPLVGAMFLGETACRRLRFRGRPHRSLFQIFDAIGDGEFLKSRPAGESGRR